MSEAVRLYQYKGLLSGRRAVSAEEIMVKLIAGAANAFGKSLFDITHAMKDRIFDIASSFSDGFFRTAGTLTEGASAATEAVVEGASVMAATVSKQISEGVDRMREKATSAPRKVKPSRKIKQ